MIVEEIVANTKEMDSEKLKGFHKEKVYLDSADLLKRIQRVKTDHGREIGIRLKDRKDLNAGDILYMDDKNMILIDVLTDDVLVIRPRNMFEMGKIAHQLGNRHLPAQFEGEEMLVQFDYLVEELLKELNLPYSHEERQLTEPFHHIGHSHDE